MKNKTEKPGGGTGKNKKESAPVNSSVDRKNNTISKGYTPATERVKPKSGDGLANEGTIASYEGDR